jgi:hypothetical protein
MSEKLTILPSEGFDISQVEPLHPSEEIRLACAHRFAAEMHLRNDGHELVNIASRRGTQAHNFVLEVYLPHLVNTGKNQDQDFWRDSLDVFQCAADTRQLLDGFLPSFRVDPETVYAVEKRYYLDAQMEPTLKYEGAALAGKPDLITIESESRAKIIDLKTQWKIVDADTIFQSRGYSLIALQVLQFVDEVEFELVFVRWNNARRRVVYNRHHLPQLKATALKLWQRKIELTRQAVTGELEAPVSGIQCQGCPLQFRCPINKLMHVNPYSMKPEDLIRLVTYAEQAAKKAREVLKDMFVSDEANPPSVTDGIGRTYTPGWSERRTRKVGSQGTFFDAVDTIREWESQGNEKRGSLFDKLSISGTSSYLKAKFREPLLERLTEAGCIAEKPTTIFKIMQSGLENDEEITYGEE